MSLAVERCRGREPNVFSPPCSGEHVDCHSRDRTTRRVHLDIGDPCLIKDLVQLRCSSKVPGETVRVVLVPVVKAIRERVGIRSKADDMQGAIDSPLVRLHCGLLFDHPGQDEPLRSGSKIICGNRAQILHFEFVVEPIVGRHWPRPTQLVEVYQRVRHSSIGQQFPDRLRDCRLARTDRAGDQQCCCMY